MLLSNADIARLEKVGYPKEQFVYFDKQKYSKLRNLKGYCFFYDNEKHRCKIYKLRPEGCFIYPVIYSEEDGVIIDDLCPEKKTVSEEEREKKGKRVAKLLGRIDRETENR